jgi:hypothetical protein
MYEDNKIRVTTVEELNRFNKLKEIATKYLEPLKKICSVELINGKSHGIGLLLKRAHKVQNEGKS